MSGPEPYLQTYWDWRAAGNFMFGGTGSGLMVAGAAAALFEVEATIPALAALAAVGAGLGLVWLEIGRRLRAMNVFRHPRMSWMTRESYAALLLFAAGLAGAWTNDPAVMVLAGAAALLFLYCQGRVLKAAKGIPVWREPRIVALIAATGLVEGVGAALVVALVLNLTGLLADAAYRDVFRSAGSLALAILLVARMIAWQRYWQRVADNAPVAAVAVLRRLQPWFLWLGHLAALVCLALGASVPALADALLAAAALLAGLAGWWLKFSLVTRAAYTQGFAIARRPARGPRDSGGAGAKPDWPTSRPADT